MGKFDSLWRGRRGEWEGTRGVGESSGDREGEGGLNSCGSGGRGGRGELGRGGRGELGRGGRGELGSRRFMREVVE